MARTTVHEIRLKKQKGEKITVLTAYDYPTAMLIDECGVDIILVGDSVANVMLGLPSTRDVGMAEMIHHARAVSRGVEGALLVGDMPYESYQKQSSDALANARRFIEEAGCGAVKLEWFEGCEDITRKIMKAGIPVMGHVGLTPQTAEELGGFKVRGKTAGAAKSILSQARQMEEAGCFSLVLECIPGRLAGLITQRAGIPTIGIGAGPLCDGQVLVTNDLLGLASRHHPKFVKRYIDLSGQIREAVSRFRDDVRQGAFPGEEHTFKISDEEFLKLDK